MRNPHLLKDFFNHIAIGPAKANGFIVAVFIIIRMDYDTSQDMYPHL